MLIAKRFKTNIAAVFLLAVAAVMLAAACGTDSGGSGGASSIPRIIESDRIYTIDDLKEGGVKTVGSPYKVEKLPGATEAWHTVFNQLEYEARFYASHEDAVAQGTTYADSVTGEDAVVTGDVMWEEGKNDRRKCSRAAGTPHSSCSYSARYLEYVIRGNMILFCEGVDTPDAFDNCDNLLKLIDPEPA